MVLQQLVIHMQRNELRPLSHTQQLPQNDHTFIVRAENYKFFKIWVKQRVFEYDTKEF